MAAAAALAEVDQRLQWIGFTDVQHRNSIIAEEDLTALMTSSTSRRQTFVTWPKVSPNVHLLRIASTSECDASSGLLP